MCPKKPPPISIKEVIDIDYNEDLVYDYDDYVELQEGTVEVFDINESTSEMSSQSLAVSLGFAEEIADAETMEYRVEHGVDNSDVDMPIIGRVEKISLKTNTKNKPNLHQRDPYFLDYVKQVCGGGDIKNRVGASWEEIF